MSTTSRLPHLVALVLMVVAIQSTYDFHKQVSARIDQQEQLIATRQKWNDQLAAMQPMEAAWQKTLPAASALSDQYRIVQHINAPAVNLTLDESTVVLGDPAPLFYGGRPIGLLRYPVANQGSYLVFTAPDFATAWQALAKLQARPDIRYTRATLERIKDTPTVFLENFAVIARAEAE